uniref:Pentapeptide repeat protein QnrB family n=1 Tax=Klebsiella pneumoniae TaxID=573 RepID=A0A8B0T0C9_KLEPN|nr:Pentapeptide repeat protein QnrB family [Klebsiella pneumoniae]
MPTLAALNLLAASFYDRESQKGCNFSRANLKDAIFQKL